MLEKVSAEIRDRGKKELGERTVIRPAIPPPTMVIWKPSAAHIFA